MTLWLFWGLREEVKRVRSFKKELCFFESLERAEEEEEEGGEEREEEDLVERDESS